MAIKLFDVKEEEKEIDIYLRLEGLRDSNASAYLSVYDEKKKLIGDIAHIMKDGTLKLIKWSKGTQKRVEPLQFDGSGYIIITKR